MRQLITNEKWLEDGRKQITIGGATFILAPISGVVWCDTIQKQFERTKSEVEFGRLSAFHTIKEWDIKDSDGNPVPVNFENFRRYLTAPQLVLLTQQAREINGIEESEKKTLQGLSSALSGGQSESTEETAGQTS